MDKVLGQGSFGCVLYPNVVCDYNQERYRPPTSEPMVSKVFVKNDRYYKLEQAIARKIASWDPRGKYLIVPIESCMTKRYHVEQNKAFSKCDEIPKDMDRFPQIVMPYAGDNLYNIITKYYINNSKKFPVENWIRMLNNILLGVYVLIKNGYLHQDIKAENILVRNGIAKLSDFGLTVPYNEVYDYHKNERIDYSYYYYPPEYLFASYYYKHKCYDICNESDMLELWNEYITYIGPKAHINYLNYLNDDSIENKLNTILYNYQQNPKEWFLRTINYIDRIDLYSVGMTCVSIEHLLDFSNISPECYNKYTTLVLGLIEPEVEKRFNIYQAYQFYRELLGSLPNFR